MKNQNRKSTWALCLSVAAIAMCLLVFSLWIFEVMPHCVIKPKSFIGVCVAVLGVIVTIAVGWQIYNAIEVKEKIAEIDRLQHKQKEQEHRMEQIYCNTCYMSGYITAALLMKEEQYVDAFRWTLMSLKFSLWLDTPMNVNEMLTALQNIQEKIPVNSVYSKRFMDEIHEHNKSIRGNKAYNIIAPQYEKIFAEFEQKVKIGGELVGFAGAYM